MTDSPAKAIIDIQSGLFEFFKQALTLASAGIAGLAAVFTDPARIPSNLLERAIAAFVGLGFISVIIGAFCGISTYANLLSVASATDISDHERILKQYKKGMVHHAKYTMISFGITAGLLFIYAFFRIISETSISFSDAVAKSEAVVSAPPFSLGPVDLNSGRIINDKYSLVFYKISDKSQYIIEVDRNNGKVISIMRK